MKKKSINVGGKELVIEAYDTDLGVLQEGSLADLKRAIHEEEEHDKRLSDVAEEVATKVSSAVTQDRAIKYWEAADAIVRYEDTIESDGRGRAPYQQVMRMLERVNEKVHDRLKGSPNVSKDRYSVPYLLKMRRLRKKMSREQVQRSVPYPFYHELLYDSLSADEVNGFLDRIEAEQITSTEQLRAEVKELRERKGVPESELQSDDSEL